MLKIKWIGATAVVSRWVNSRKKYGTLDVADTDKGHVIRKTDRPFRKVKIRSQSYGAYEPRNGASKRPDPNQAAIIMSESKAV